MFSRAAWIVVFCLSASVLACVYIYALHEARTGLLTEARETARLSVEVVRAELDRRRHIPTVLAADEAVIANIVGVIVTVALFAYNISNAKPGAVAVAS